MTQQQVETSTAQEPPPPVQTPQATPATAASVPEASVPVAAPAAETVTAAAPVPAPAPAVPAGRPIDVDPAAAGPGEIVQLDHLFPSGTVLRGLVVGEGLVVRTVLVGRFRFPATEADRWESCYGMTVPDQAFTIVLAENVTHETIIARATWFVEGGGAQASHPMASPSVGVPVLPASPAPGASAQPASPPASPTAAPQGAWPPTVSQVHVPPPPPAAPVSPRAVTPGTNEVAVLLQRSECERLLSAITGGAAVEHQHIPSIIRQLHAALVR